MLEYTPRLDDAFARAIKVIGERVLIGLAGAIGY